jgi:hypothetical protein
MHDTLPNLFGASKTDCRRAWGGAKPRLSCERSSHPQCYRSWGQMFITAHCFTTKNAYEVCKTMRYESSTRTLQSAHLLQVDDDQLEEPESGNAETELARNAGQHKPCPPSSCKPRPSRWTATLSSYQASAPQHNTKPNTHARTHTWLPSRRAHLLSCRDRSHPKWPSHSSSRQS